MSRPLPRWIVALIQGFLIGAAVVVVIVTFFVSFPAVETRYWPVVSKLQIDKLDPGTQNRSIIYASFEKLRQCDYIGIAWFERQADGSMDRVPIEILRRPGDVSSPNRPVGRTSAGPWVVPIPPDEVRITSVVQLTHRCHPFWTSVTNFYP